MTPGAGRSQEFGHSLRTHVSVHSGLLRPEGVVVGYGGLARHDAVVSRFFQGDIDAFGECL